jgi:mono/diheme cytochrome c family protein
MKREFSIAIAAITLMVAGGIVWAVAALDGAALYAANCAGCHGPLATSGKQGAPPLRIQTAIGSNRGGMGSLSSLSADQIQSIADALAPPVVYDARNFTVDGRKWQPAPTGHLAGKDNGPGEAIHHPGEDCGICHTPGGRAGNKVWTMSGTVYDSRGARTPLAGAEVIFQNISGQVFSMTSNELGNFWTDKPFFNNPNNSNSANWNYKAWVRYGNSVRPMPSIAPVGGGRMSCSMHHAGLGSRGGLWVLPASTLRSYPASGLSYRKHIFPILRSKCAPCHIPGDTTSRAPAGEAPFDSSHGLDLMTYEGSSVVVPGYTPHGSTVPVPDKTWAKQGILSKVNTASPAASLILIKTLEGASHGGGSFWSTSDADYKAILQWIAEGAQKN